MSSGFSVSTLAEWGRKAAAMPYLTHVYVETRGVRIRTIWSGRYLDEIVSYDEIARPPPGIDLVIYRIETGNRFWAEKERNSALEAPAPTVEYDDD